MYAGLRPTVFWIVLTRSSDISLLEPPNVLYFLNKCDSLITDVVINKYSVYILKKTTNCFIVVGHCSHFTSMTTMEKSLAM